MRGVISYKTTSRNVIVTFSELDDRYQEKIVANNNYEGGYSYRKNKVGIMAIQTRFAAILNRISRHGYEVVRAELLL